MRPVPPFTKGSVGEREELSVRPCDGTVSSVSEGLQTPTRPWCPSRAVAVDSRFVLSGIRTGRDRNGSNGRWGALQGGILPSDLGPSACPCIDFTLRKRAVTPAVDAAPRDPCLPRRWRLCPLPASVDDSVGPPEGLALFLSGLCSSWEDVSPLIFPKRD